MEENTNMTDNLEIYSHLARFCLEENIERLPFKRTHKQLVLKDYIASALPSPLENMRSVLDNCLKFAYRYDALKVNDPRGKNRRARLKGDEAKNFWSLINEFRVGMWLENQGLILQLDPPARNRCFGDYKVTLAGNSIFIEIKTIFGDKNLLEQEGFVSKLGDYLEQKKLPVIRINLVKYPNGFDIKKTNPLFVDIENFICSHIPGLSKEVVVKYNRQDFSIKFTLSPGSPYVRSKSYGSFVGIDNQIKTILGMKTDKEPKEIQVSTNDIPNMVVIYDWGHYTESIIEGILYGTEVYASNKSGLALLYREKNGLWNTEKGRLISAVAVFTETPNGQYNLNVKIYLCPEPNFPLPVKCFNDEEICWHGLSDDGRSSNVGVLDPKKE